MEKLDNIDNLLEAITSENVSERRTAAKDLVYTDERAVYPLLKALRDENPGVQDAAMRSLMGIGGEVVAYMVLPLLRENSFLRNTAMLILKDIGVASVNLLYPLLADKDDDVRKFALDLLGDIKDTVDPGRIFPLLKDPNANVRASAVRAIGLTMPEGALETLIQSLDDEEWVSFAALETLATIKDERAVDAIARKLSDESMALRVAAIESLGSIGSGKASEALFDFVKKSDGMEQNEAIKSLVQTGVTPSMSAVYDLLLELVQVGEWEDQEIAIKGLVDLKDVNAIPFIIDMAGVFDESIPGDDEKIIFIKKWLKQFGSTDIYAQVLKNRDAKFKSLVLAAEMAGETCSDSAVPVLMEYLDGDLRDVKRACALALGKIGTPEAVEALMRAIDDREGHVRKTAIMGLGHTGSDAAFDRLLIQLEEEEYDDIIEQTVKALIDINEKELYSHIEKFPARIKEAVARASGDLEMLLRLSADEDLSVVLAALAGLGAFSDGSAVERILEAVRSFDPEVRRTAAMALSGMEVGLDVVIPLLEDKDMWVRLHAVRMLGNGGEDTLPLLERMLRDCDVPVVLAAVESVAAVGGREAYDMLAAAEGHEDSRVREVVAAAIERM